VKNRGYPPKLVRGLLLNWKDVEASEQENFVIMRCDIELTIKRLKPDERKAINTVRLEGEDALTRQVVMSEEFDAIVRRMVYILNEEGVVEWWDTQKGGKFEYSSNKREALFG
jgi:hypothetical protein